VWDVRSEAISRSVRASSDELLFHDSRNTT